MDIAEFTMLPDHQQYDLVFAKGDFIKSHVDANQSCNLYALWFFFMEVRYDPLSNTILGKDVFQEGVLLDKYTTGL